MNNRRPRPKSIALKGSPTAQVYRTYEDWQTEQQADLRTPEQRGIVVGTPVMWRHRTDAKVIVTERAVVLAVEDTTLTLQVKDVETRICSAEVWEIVTNQFGHSSATDANQRAFLANQMETNAGERIIHPIDESQPLGSWV